MNTDNRKLPKGRARMMPLPPDSVAAQLETIAGLTGIATATLTSAVETSIADDFDTSRSLIGSAAWRLADAAALLAQLARAMDLTGPGLTEPTGRGATLPADPTGKAGR